MSTLELFLIAVGLSMDAFAVSVCKGLALKRVTLKNCLVVGFWFGLFQALMPFLGYHLGSAFGDYIVAVDHWVAFALLGIIGGKMLLESFDQDREGDDSLRILLMLSLALATSIDALAVGITFALLPDVNVVYAVLFIGVTTFLLSALGVRMGQQFGARQSARAERLGGLILIGIGLKILVDHLGLF